MAITVPRLQSYIGAGLNVLITGQAGTGKTAMLKEATSKLGLQMKYYSASTLDPFADLVGIPVPDTTKRQLDYYRPHDVDNAEVIFFDELNRAEPKTLNTVFEIIQFRSINGEPLPNLKCVVAAINPVEDGYETEELDVALLDRFDIYLESAVEADYTYLKAKYGAAYARVAKAMFDDYQASYLKANRSKKNSMGYFSPRRLDKLMEIYQKFPERATFAAVLPADVVVSAKKNSEDFDVALGRASGPAAPPAGDPGLPVPPPEAGAQAVRDQLRLDSAAMRKKANSNEFFYAYRYAKVHGTEQDVKKLRAALAVALNSNVGPETIRLVWGEAVKEFTPADRAKMTSSWPWKKLDTMSEQYKLM